MLLEVVVVSPFPFVTASRGIGKMTTFIDSQFFSGFGASKIPPSVIFLTPEKNSGVNKVFRSELFLTPGKNRILKKGGSAS